MQTQNPLQTEPSILENLQIALNDLLHIEAITVQDNSDKPLIKFTGQLVDGDHEAQFDDVIDQFMEYGYTLTLREGDGHHIVEAIPRVVNHKTGNPWVNLGLFILTIISVLIIGAMHENVSPEALIQQPQLIFQGWKFAVTLLGILTAHELSHYFMGLRYGSPTSLPYFIPMPLTILGTMGAVIVQRGPMRSRKALFDIGIAGPIGGLILAIPLLFYGIATSDVVNARDVLNIPPGEPVELMQEGNSLLYFGAKYLIHGRVLPDKQTGEDLWMSPPSQGGSIAFAAWAGLLVSMFNLLPIGQLDGGHVAYAMWGRKAWKLARVFLYILFGWGIFLLVMGNVGGSTWLIWSALSSLMGAKHPQPLNDVTPIDKRRRILGWVMVVVFVLILTPIPLIPVTQ